MSFKSQRIGRKRRVRLFLIIALALAIVLSASVEGVYQYRLRQAPSAASGSEAFLISTGESAKSVAERLQEEGFVPSSWAFLRYADKKGLATEFQAGRFYLAKNLTIPQLAERLIAAENAEITVAIPEGYTNAEIDAKLTDLKLIDPGEFLACVQNCDFSAFPFLPPEKTLREGFFFPDSYFVSPDHFQVEEFARRMLTNFDTKTKPIFGSAQRNGWEILKMASIIEKESYNTEERPIVAGILWKRLDSGELIGADATTRYITGKKTEPLTVEDLQDKNPWNTRAVRGLPPGAISNPGVSAIEAAANPQESEYWYYLHDAKGQIHYGKTLDEHNQNVAEFL